MNLNNILLNNQMLAGLYSDSLVETQTESASGPTVPAAVPATPVKGKAASTSGELTSASEQAAPDIAQDTSATRVAPASVQIMPATGIPAPKYLGNNNRKILILVSNSDVAFLPDDELSFLTSILSACKLGLADVAILNTSHHNDAASLIQIIESEKVLLFGLEPLETGLPFHFPHFQLQEFDKRTYLTAPILNVLQNDKVLKLKLWNSLKTLFCI
jgi:hypothetical protein